MNSTSNSKSDMNYKTTFHPINHHSRIHELDLIVPSSHTHFLTSKFSANKIKREIDDLNKLLNSEGVSQSGFRNRPILNVNRPELEFCSRKYVANSPTVTRRGSLTTSDIFKNYKARHEMEDLHTYTGKVHFSKNQACELEQFSREFKIGKTKILSIAERYPPSSRRRDSAY
jgi:hypothetical protein